MGPVTGGLHVTYAARKPVVTSGRGEERSSLIVGLIENKICPANNASARSRVTPGASAQGRHIIHGPRNKTAFLYAGVGTRTQANPKAADRLVPACSLSRTESVARTVQDTRKTKGDARVVRPHRASILPSHAIDGSSPAGPGSFYFFSLLGF